MTPGVCHLEQESLRDTLPEVETIASKASAFVALTDMAILPYIGLRQFSLLPTRYKTASFSVALPTQGGSDFWIFTNLICEK